jgi:hypothetical protein
MRNAGLIISLLVLGACTTHIVPPYAVSSVNSSGLRASKAPEVSVGRFDAFAGVDLSPACGDGTVVTSDGTSLDEYVRQAFVDELTAAEKFNPKSPLVLNATITELNYSPEDGHWDLALVVRSTNGKSLAVLEEYSFQTTHTGETACIQAANAFVLAVQQMVGKVFTNEEFPELLVM